MRTEGTKGESGVTEAMGTRCFRKEEEQELLDYNHTPENAQHELGLLTQLSCMLHEHLGVPVQPGAGAAGIPDTRSNIRRWSPACLETQDRPGLP